MILVKCKKNWKNKFWQSLEIDGHSGYAEKGKDLVCSAVSVITNGLVNYLKDNFPDFIEFTSSKERLVIKIFKKELRIQLILEFVFFQLSNLAINYPENLKVTIRNS